MSDGLPRALGLTLSVVVAVARVGCGRQVETPLQSATPVAGESSPGTVPLDEATLVEDIWWARQQADIVVVLPHWGAEYTLEALASPDEASQVRERIASASSALP